MGTPRGSQRGPPRAIWGLIWTTCLLVQLEDGDVHRSEGLRAQREVMYKAYEDMGSVQLNRFYSKWRMHTSQEQV